MHITRMAFATAALLAGAAHPGYAQTKDVTIVGQSQPVVVTGMVAVEPSSKPTPVTVTGQSAPVAFRPATTTPTTVWGKAFTYALSPGGTANNRLPFDEPIVLRRVTLNVGAAGTGNSCVVGVTMWRESDNFPVATFGYLVVAGGTSLSQGFDVAELEFPVNPGYYISIFASNQTSGACYYSALFQGRRL